MKKLELSGLDKYNFSLIKAIQPVVLNRSEEDNQALRDSLKNDLFDLDGPRQTSTKFTTTERLIGRLFFDYMEIHKSFLNLQDIEIYARRFPYGDTNISRVRYLQYHIANYLHEVYILQERLTTYLTIIKRRYRKSKNIEEIKATCDLLNDFVLNALNGIVATRGVHVHQARYSDRDISRLETFELLQDADNKYLSHMYNEEYKKIRKNWVKQIKLFNIMIRNLLDDYFSKLHSILFSEEGDLILPNTVT